MGYSKLLHAVKSLPPEVGFVSGAFWISKRYLQDVPEAHRPVSPECGCLFGTVLHDRMEETTLVPCVSVNMAFKCPQEEDVVREIRLLGLKRDEAVSAETASDSYERGVNNPETMLARRAYVTKWLEERVYGVQPIA